MPQNRELSSAWRSELGDDWQQVQEQWLHTLGNLTLTAYNSEYSDRPFSDKRDMTGGFRESPLRVNAGLGQAERWNAQAIKARGERLASQAINVWCFPTLPDSILEQYHAPTAAPSTYSLDDHPHLQKGLTRELFDAFRREVLALDPCVTEEFLKLYVAYKAETNFVDIVPQASGLRLSLNMKFSEIADPRNICEDVTNIGRWGNGDIQVRLSNQDDLPYVVGLVRQSLERQLGNMEEL